MRADGRNRAVDYLIVILTLLAPLLGGTTDQWSQGIVVLAGATLIWVSPPRRWPGRWVLIFSMVLLAVGLVCFLPHRWFGELGWRARMIPDGGVRLAGTLTVQPWLSLQAWLLLGSGVVWGLYLMSREWSASPRRLMSLYAAVCLVLGVFGIVFFATDYLPPWWKDERANFGPFPNRNQTANVLALAGILQLALAYHAFGRGRRFGYFWAASSVLTGVGIVVSGSRGGTILLLAGALGWLLWVTAQTGRLNRTSLGVAGVLFGLTAFLLFGGKTWERLEKALKPEREMAVDFRIPVQKDAWALLGKTSWHGIGVGNFDAVFARHRVASAAENRVIHPESDWFWLGIELGWVGLAAVLGVLAAWLAQNWPRAHETHFYLRSGMVAGVLVFCLHGITDVSGHRVGALWPALLLFGLIRRPGADGTTPRAVGRAFRLAALVPGGAALWWLIAALGFTTWPTYATVDQARTRVQRLLSNGFFGQAAELATRALEFAPLDAGLYFNRAVAALGTDDIAGAVVDFHRSRHFEANSAEWCYVQGAALLLRSPVMAMAPWYEALERARRSWEGGTGRKQALYRRMLADSADFPEIRHEVRALAGDDPELIAVFLRSAGREEFDQELRKLLLADPELASIPDAQKSELFLLWAQKGDRQFLEEQLARKPEWQSAGWFALATLRAGRGEYPEACALFQQYGGAPVLPEVRRTEPRRQLERDFLLRPDDFYTGYSLFRAHLDEGDADAALLTVRKLTNQAGCPKYLHHLEGTLWAEREKWREAWLAWARYAGGVK